MKHTPGERSRTTPGADEDENVLARMEYFYQRVTYPNGTIPEGALLKAWRYSREHMSLYHPGNKHTPQASFEWRNLGPHNIGGRIVALAVNPTNPRTILIGAADGGIWRSYDEGASWHSVSDELPTQAMGALVIDPVDTAIVYAGTGEANFAINMFDGAGMFKSTDGGTTWTQIGSGSIPDFARVSDLAINPLNPEILFAAIPDGVPDADRAGIYRSSDGGTTWNLVFTGMMTDIVIDPINPQNIYTAASPVSSGRTSANVGMYKSTDGGENWIALDIGVDPSTMGRTSIGICAGNPQVLYIGVSELSGSGRTYLLGVFKTTDAGASWTKLTVPFDYMVSQGWFDNIIGVHPSNPDIVYAGGVKLIRSEDGGVTWTRIPDEAYGGILHVDQHAIEFNPADPDRVFIGNDGGFFIGSQNGTRWIKSDLGLSITQFIGGAMHPMSDAFLLGGTQDNGTMMSINAPMWGRVLFADGGNSAVNPLKPNVLYATQQNARLWRSDDFGQTWTQTMGNLPIEGSLFYIDYAIDKLNPNILYYGTYRMYKSTDDARTWTLLRSCMFPVGASCYYISSIDVAPYDGNIVMAGATGGHVGISRDGGQQWDITIAPLPTAYCSAVRSFKPDVFYATHSRYGVDKVWRSVDGGTTWTSLNGNLPDIPVNDIIELDGKLIIGTHLGTFISADDGTTWQRFGSGMPTVAVFKLRYNGNTGTLRAITHGRGMYDMQWMQPSLSKPLFLSRPDTTILEPGQPFLYAPVVQAHPAPRYSLLEGPPGAIIDPDFGIVEWKGGTKIARFTMRATNSEGSADQVFLLATNDVVTTDWQIVSTERFLTPVNSMYRTTDKTFWIARDSAWISRSTDEGSSWTHSRIQGTNAAILTVHGFDALNAIVGTRGGQMLRTSDGGVTWKETYRSLNARFGNIHFWDDSEGIAISEGHRDSTDVLFSSDGGNSWIRSTAPRAFAYGPLDNSLYFFDRTNGWYGSGNQNASPPIDASVIRTTDGGITWSTSSAGTRTTSGFAFLNPQRGFLIDHIQNRVRRTVNGGASWPTTFYPMNGLRCRAISAHPSSGTVWIVTDTSAWVTRNEGSSWMRTQLVPAGSIADAVFSDTSQGWAISSTGLLQRYIPGTISSAATAITTPEDIRLGHAYPNPLTDKHPEAVIPFRLMKHAHVVVKIHDGAGREIATLVDDLLPQGEHFTAWSAAHVVNGVYFYTLTAGTVLKTGRMVIVK